MKSGGRRRTVVLAVALVVLAAGCDWSQWGYDNGGSRYNSSETSWLSALNAQTTTTAWVGLAGGSIGTSSAVTDIGRVFVGSSNGVVYSFDETGSDQCTAGTPTTCNPQWSSAPEGQAIDSTPTTGPNGVLLVGGNNDTLYAYDQNGTNGCSGTPKVCQPLWTAAGSGGGDMSTPVVAGSVVYAHDAANLYAFDAGGQTNCSGTVCQPLWTASGGSAYPLPVAVAGSTVYTVGSSGLAAFDAAGHTNCSGTPAVCQPLWTSTNGAGQFGVAVVGNRVYAADTSVYAFDAAGAAGCSGSPRVCSPLWTGNTGTPSQVYSPFAIANNVL
jgi:hypothetical protein